ncbi:CC_3452 family protein [Qipengyuania sediminis]|uniref:CC_3452 family protein n=1 Tax=Qipengyuania sediminis TaxID=1532023 RepID=UPI00105A8499|nr:hypothetical protein [Qipengyuania sediminis]
MTPNLPRASSLGAISLALAWTALSFTTAVTPSPAFAQGNGGANGKGYYRAELAQPASKLRAIAGDVVWTCNGTACTAPKGTSRPLRVCRDVQRKFGQVVRFTAKGEELPANQLAQCNS